MPASLKGAIVGFFNTIAVAFCICTMAPGESSAQIVVLVTMLGAIPGVLAGALIAFIADQMKHVNRRVVLLSMIVMACIAVTALGNMFDMQKLTLVSCIPTAAACSILERWMRPRPEESFPVARVA